MSVEQFYIYQIHLSFHQSIYRSVYLKSYPPMNLSIYLSTHNIRTNKAKTPTYEHTRKQTNKQKQNEKISKNTNKLPFFAASKAMEKLQFFFIVIAETIGLKAATMTSHYPNTMQPFKFVSFGSK